MCGPSPSLPNQHTQCYCWSHAKQEETEHNLKKKLLVARSFDDCIFTGTASLKFLPLLSSSLLPLFLPPFLCRPARCHWGKGPTRAYRHRSSV